MRDSCVGSAVWKWWNPDQASVQDFHEAVASEKSSDTSPMETSTSLPCHSFCWSTTLWLSCRQAECLVICQCFPYRTPSARIKSASRARTGSPKEVLEVPFRHQLNGVDHLVCRVPNMTEGRPLAISPPPDPRTPRSTLFLRSWRAGT